MATAAKMKKNAPPPAPNRSYLVIGALGLAGAAVLAYLVLKPKDVSIPANVTILAADTAGFRGYVLGSPTARGDDRVCAIECFAQGNDFLRFSCAVAAQCQRPDAGVDQKRHDLERSAL